MKKTIFILSLTTLMAGTIFIGCQSSAQKQEAVKVKLQNAANAEEWKTFKSESELKIKNNELRIAELREEMNKPGKIFDAIYAKRIDTLEQQNNDLKARIEAYEKSQSDWESFKREFNHDMDELRQALTDLTVDNKN